MKKWMFGLAAVVAIAGCNSEGGDGSGSGSGSGGSGTSLTLDADTADAYASFVDMGIDFRDSMYSSVDDYIAGRSASSRNLDNCVSESFSGNSSSGSGSIVYNNCSMSGSGTSITLDGDIDASWTSTTFNFEGSYTMTVSADGQTVEISFDPFDITVVDNGTTISSDMDFKFIYSDGTNSGYLAMETVEPIIAPSSSPSQVTSGKIKMNDDSGNIFYITYSDGSYVVQQN